MKNFLRKALLISHTLLCASILHAQPPTPEEYSIDRIYVIQKDRLITPESLKKNIRGILQHLRTPIKEGGKIEFSDDELRDRIKKKLAKYGFHAEVILQKKRGNLHLILLVSSPDPLIEEIVWEGVTKQERREVQKRLKKRLHAMMPLASDSPKALKRELHDLIKEKGYQKVSVKVKVETTYGEQKKVNIKVKRASQRFLGKVTFEIKGSYPLSQMIYHLPYTQKGRIYLWQYPLLFFRAIQYRDYFFFLKYPYSQLFKIPFSAAKLYDDACSLDKQLERQGFDAKIDYSTKKRGHYLDVHFVIDLEDPETRPRKYITQISWNADKSIDDATLNKELGLFPNRPYDPYYIQQLCHYTAYAPNIYRAYIKHKIPKLIVKAEISETLLPNGEVVLKGKIREMPAPMISRISLHNPSAKADIPLLKNILRYHEILPGALLPLYKVLPCLTYLAHSGLYDKKSVKITPIMEEGNKVHVHLFLEGIKKSGLGLVLEGSNVGGNISFHNLDLRKLLHGKLSYGKGDIFKTDIMGNARSLKVRVGVDQPFIFHNKKLCSLGFSASMQHRLKKGNTFDIRLRWKESHVQPISASWGHQLTLRQQDLKNQPIDQIRMIEWKLTYEENRIDDPFFPTEGQTFQAILKNNWTLSHTPWKGGLYPQLTLQKAFFQRSAQKNVHAHILSLCAAPNFHAPLGRFLPTVGKVPQRLIQPFFFPFRGKIGGSSSRLGACYALLYSYELRKKIYKNPFTYALLFADAAAVGHGYYALPKLEASVGAEVRVKTPLGNVGAFFFYSLGTKKFGLQLRFYTSHKL